MRKLLDRSAAVLGLALFSTATFAMSVEDAQMLVGKAGLYALVLILVVTVAFVCFRQLPDMRSATLQRVLNDEPDTKHSVQADALVMECVRMMADRRTSALLVMDGARLIGIFTEWDALSKVLAVGRDPRDTRIVEVMTTNPVCFLPETTVDAAMKLVASKHFHHLPVVENGVVRAVLSVRNLTHWLARNQGREIQELVAFAS